MRLILLTIIFCLPLAAQTTTDVQVTLTFQNEAVPAIKDFIERNFMSEADVNEDEVLQNAEALNWFRLKCQNVVDTFTDRALKEAEEDEDRKTRLPQSLQDAIAAFETAKAALETERDKWK